VDVVARTAVAFVLIAVVTRLIGRRELSGLEPFDIILLVVLGDLVQQGVTQSDYSLTGMVLVIATLAVLTVALSWLGFRIGGLRQLLEGTPLVLIEDGRVIDRNLRRERIRIEEVAAAARAQGLASLEDVRFAILETNGTISIVPR
jgi:uncharacterized membrane protein YcaP (DUF421 family)